MTTERSGRITFDSWLPIAGAALMSIVATGCAVGPDYRPPAAPTAARFTATPLPPTTAGGSQAADRAQHFVAARELPAAWWTAFDSRELDSLVEAALRHSPTLDLARATLRQAQELEQAQRGAFWPSVQADYAPLRARVPDAVASPLSSGAAVYTLHTSQLSVGYVFDLFGANRRGVESLAAQSEAQRWQLRGARLTLAANVATAALQWASLREQQEAVERLLEIATDQWSLMRVQQGVGEVSSATVLAQEALVGQVQSSAAAIAKTLAWQHDALAVLLGVPPSELPAPTLRLDALRLADVPDGLPARLVEQRPDVRAAQAAVHAANAQVGVAVSNMLPQISLSANYGASAQSLSQLFGAAGLLWSVGANIAQPVFDGGTLLHRKNASQAQLDQALAQYRGTVLTAFQNVADSLEAVRHDADQSVAAARQERLAQAGLAIASRQLELGDISRLVLLNAEAVVLQASLARIQVQANRFVDVCAVYQSLGGGWDVEDDAAR